MPLLTRTRAPKPTAPAAVLPDGASLLLAMRDDGPAGALDPHPVLAIGVRLAAQHRRQWAAEDLCRRPGASDADVAATKRTIRPAQRASCAVRR